MLRYSNSVVLLICVAVSGCNGSSSHARRFPDGFMFGAATAAYQVEGGWNEDDGTTGDIAADSYHLYKRDVEMLRELGVDFYRFSISWNRIMPSSFPDNINEAGVEYYNKLIDELLRHNIQPMITLYHLDLPQKLQEMGGWSNPYVVHWFGDYARVAFTLFGDRVKYWITVNQPEVICYYGYGSRRVAPALSISGVADYMCTKNILLAHARAYHIYDAEFRHVLDGNIFITLLAHWYVPETKDDVVAAEEANMMQWGSFAHPIFSQTGDFPLIMKQRVAAKSAQRGFFRSRLPELTREEVDYIKGTADLLGLNHYYTYLTYRNGSVVGLYDRPSYQDDVGVMTYQKDEWKTSVNAPVSDIKCTPWGYNQLLTYIREAYNNPTIFVTEAGFSTTRAFDDYDRVDYYRQYLDAMLDAMDEGSDIRAYTAWSLMDNFEWLRGYIPRFGLYDVDFESPKKTRTPRVSAFWYKELLRTRTLDFHCQYNGTKMIIDD